MPATGRVLLDTNMVIALLAAEPVVVERVAAAEALYLERLPGLAGTSAVLTCDAETASRYGELKASLRAKGTPIPENDLWIAALAKQHDLTVASRDEHFDLVPGVVRVAWTKSPSTPP